LINSETHLLPLLSKNRMWHPLTYSTKTSTRVQSNTYWNYPATLAAFFSFKISITSS
jgi:hypothetical protein